jgi:hypothetical protein
VRIDVPCDRVLAVPGDRRDLGDRVSALHLQRDPAVPEVVRVEVNDPSVLISRSPDSHCDGRVRVRGGLPPCGSRGSDELFPAPAAVHSLPTASATSILRHDSPIDSNRSARRSHQARDAVSNTRRRMEIELVSVLRLRSSGPLSLAKNPLQYTP